MAKRDSSMMSTAEAVLLPKPGGIGGSIELRVNGCDELQYRNGGSWTTFAKLRLRLHEGNLQLSLDPSETPTYCTWETTTECIED
jgi:hypothetical protein